MSRYKRVYLLKKSEAFARFKEFVTEVECELGARVKQLRDDKGGEYMSSEFIQYCKDKGISRQHTVKATPQQNPIAERLNRTLAEGTVAMLSQANLPVTFWGQAVLYLTHILNVTPSSALSDTTSYEVWKRRKPDLTMYRVFGCRAFVHIQKRDRKPLNSHTIRCIFVGFEEGYKGWKVYDPATQKVLTSRDVIFNETSFPGTGTDHPGEPAPGVLPHDLWPEKEGQDAEMPPHDERTTPAPDREPVHDQDFSRATPSPSDLQSSHEQNMTTELDLSSDYRPLTPQPTNQVDSQQQSLPVHPIPHRHAAPISNDRVPLVARGDRPIRKKRILDYGELDGRRRRTTQPVARRQHQPEGENGEEGEHTVDNMDAGGDYVQMTTQEDVEDSGNSEHAFHTTPMVDAINYVYGQNGTCLPILAALDIVLEMAVERAFGAAVRPEDSPRGWKEAMARPDCKKGIKAAQIEIDALIDNGTWELVELPADRRAIGSRWVFIVKRQADGMIERYKARLVARGDNQRPGIDYNQVFAPTARWERYDPY